MKRKIVWLILSSLTLLSLVAAACGAPEVTEQPPVTEQPGVTQQPEQEIAVKTETDKPKYGGVLNLVKDADIQYFDATTGNPASAITAHYTNEGITGTDWTKGPAGGYGAQETWMGGKVDLWGIKAGTIAESWELPTSLEGDTAIMTYHIRQGVNWALNPQSEASRLVGGREVTAEDVLWSMQITITDKRQYLYSRNPELRVIKVTSPEPWTVRLEIPWDIYETASFRFSDYVLVFPREVYEKYNGMSDWRVSVGTGPFMLTNNVPSSSASFIRNPNYWRTNPIGPGKGDQLPYLDGVKILIITDMSTIQAALRTGKVDGIADDKTEFTWEDIKDTVRLQPDLKYKMRAMSSADMISMRTDKPPFNDIRVREALMRATDFQSINQFFFANQGQIVTVPLPYMPEYADAYYGPEPDGVWPDDATEFSKSLYQYDPGKAKQLLAEAGYPEGFKTSINIPNEVRDIDYMSIIKDMWLKVGVDLEIRPEETAVHAVTKDKKDYEMYGADGPSPLQYAMLTHWYPADSYQNFSFVNDPKINETYAEIQATRLFDPEKSMQMFREVGKYAHDQVYYIPMVTGTTFNVWWPWIKNYNGEIFMGNLQRQAYTYAWLDQELKKEMGY
ncbi:MAG: ABC transporter substrate-binding protein [Dehalococcoidales bacterium]|nr:ABC transporter substrate-binding protein [Dehalococcoidales bacterium]